jgi:hypothetical protein
VLRTLEREAHQKLLELVVRFCNTCKTEHELPLTVTAARPQTYDRTNNVMVPYLQAAVLPHCRSAAQTPPALPLQHLSDSRCCCCCWPLLTPRSCLLLGHTCLLLRCHHRHCLQGCCCLQHLRQCMQLLGTSLALLLLLLSKQSQE